MNAAPLEELSRVLASADDPVLIRDFLRSLLTEHEVKDISSRWILVRLLDKGMSQRGIAEELGLSLCKITRGSRELKKPSSPFKKMLRLFECSCEQEDGRPHPGA